MSEVKRWSVESDEHSLWNVESAEGEFVTYEDYAALKEQFDFKQNLTEQVVALQKQCDALAAENVALKGHIDDECYIANPTGMDYIGAYASSVETPATDAYLNSLRDDVIKQLHSEQKEWALVTWQYDSFDALKRAAVRHGDSELSGVIFMLDRIEGFAAQLRAGKDGE